MEKFTDYTHRYIELNSMLFDLYPFVPMLSKETRSAVIAKVRETIDAITDEKRKARATINLYKMIKVFGFY